MKTKVKITIEHPDNDSADWLLCEIMRYVNDVNSDIENGWSVQMEGNNV